jgi:hypothetical protein
MSPPQRQLAPFQFPLRSLFIATLIVAILAWLVTVLPPEAWLFLTITTLPIFAMVAAFLGVVYLRGRWRAFWLGFGIALIHVLLLGLFSGFLWGRGPWREEAMLIIPVYTIVVPLISGWLGLKFYRAGQAANAQPAPESAPTQPIPHPAADRPLGVDAT